MCFFIDDSFPKPKIAKKDIVVYKLAFKTEGKFYPICQASNEIKLNHIYHAKDKFRKNIKKFRKSNDNIIKYGIHGFTDENMIDNYAFHVRLQCIIPKGTLYMFNNKHEFIAIKIKPVKVIYQKE